MPDEDVKTFKVEGAQLIFKNFSGTVTPYNKDGKKEFCVILDEEYAQVLIADSWTVRYLEPREEGDTPTPYISVKVNFDVKPPRVIMLTNDGKTRTPLTNDSIGILDWADIANVDLICNAFNWHVGDKSGVKAYLKTMFVTINEDELERKYAINDNPVGEG